MGQPTPCLLVRTGGGWGRVREGGEIGVCAHAHVCRKGCCGREGEEKGELPHFEGQPQASTPREREREGERERAREQRFWSSRSATYLLCDFGSVTLLP